MSDFWNSFVKRASSSPIPRQRDRSDSYSVFVRQLVKEGGFYYSWTPSGKIVGRVSVDGQTKVAMEKNPAAYIGRMAKVSAAARNKKKGLISPTFQQFLSAII